MKVYLSADIEGVAGITHSEEANPDHRSVRYFQEQMTREVAAACEGALSAGATEIWVKDAHWTGRNLDPRLLPREVRLIRGWSGHPYRMMQEIDGSFAASLFVGYHSRAGSAGNPLAHSFSGRVIGELRLNGTPASELLVNQWISLYENVPTVFLSGDQALCAEAAERLGPMVTVASFVGRGPSTITRHPEVICDEIKAGVKKALSDSSRAACRFDLPKEFAIEIDFKDVKLAYGASYYPGAAAVGEYTVRFQSTDFFEALRFMYFATR